MTRIISLAVGLFLVMILCVGCGGKENRNTSVEDKLSIEMSGHDKSIGNTETAEEQPTSALKQEPEVLGTKEEEEEMFGTVDEQGNWTPPEGSYVDPKTGTILNKDGVVVGTTQKPTFKARPGSKG